LMNLLRMDSDSVDVTTLSKIGEWLGILQFDSGGSVYGKGYLIPWSKKKE
jgi:hypothetical protein